LVNFLNCTIFFIKNHVNNHPNNNNIIEIIIDLDYGPEVRFIHDSEYLLQIIISWQDIESLTKPINKFNNDNRSGIKRTLHLISCIQNRQFLRIGLTCCIGWVIFGTISVIRDLLESDQSILILGKTGVVKTIIIR